MIYERGIPSNNNSLSYYECVPVVCTHRPSLSQMDSDMKSFGSEYLELDKVQVVTRLRSVNQPQDHYINIYVLYIFFFICAY